MHLLRAVRLGLTSLLIHSLVNSCQGCGSLNCWKSNDYVKEQEKEKKLNHAALKAHTVTVLVTRLINLNCKKHNHLENGWYGTADRRIIELILSSLIT